jgi:hypothetical protein
MTKRLLLLPAAAFLAAISSGIAHAQTFKVEKFDIKGDGGTDYVAAEAATGRVFVSRGTHMMVVDGQTAGWSATSPTRPACMARAWRRKLDTGSRRTAATRPSPCSI